MEILYLGHYENGSTSRMRGEYLKEILQPKLFSVADINIPLLATNKIARSFGWRYKKGPLIKNINQYAVSIINNKWNYDLVWIDKGVFIDPAIVEKLKQQSAKLVHFTPDPAFAYHRSKLFYSAIPYYDYCITTKSFEIELYKQQGANVLFCTQGFHPAVHRPYYSFAEKRGAVFIGHHEKWKEEIIAKLLENKIAVTLAGINWQQFAKKKATNNLLHYKGKGIFGEEYARAISKAQIGLGFLSKLVPELHTTRTFEIPACCTALLTEYTTEIANVYKDDEAIFYSSPDELVTKTKYALQNPAWLNAITQKGHQKIVTGGYDYKSILQKLLAQIYP
jgi:hypothetical protein